MLLFRLYEKVTKKYTEGGGPLDSRGAVQSAVSTCFFRNLIGSFLNQLSCFEPVRNGGFTAQGFVSFYKKNGFDLGGQQVMCFMELAGFGGGCF